MEKLPQFIDAEHEKVKKMNEIIGILEPIIADEKTDLDMEKISLEEISRLLDSISDIVKNNTMTEEEEHKVNGYLCQLSNKLIDSADSAFTFIDKGVLEKISEKPTEEEKEKRKLFRQLMGLGNRAREISHILWRRGIEDKELK